MDSILVRSVLLMVKVPPVTFVSRPPSSKIQDMEASGLR